MERWTVCCLFHISIFIVLTIWMSSYLIFHSDISFIYVQHVSIVMLSDISRNLNFCQSKGLWKMINCGKTFYFIKVSSKYQINIWFDVMFTKYVVRNILCIFHFLDFPKIPRCFPYYNNLLKKDVETGNVPQSRARGHSITTSTIFFPVLTTYLPVCEHFYPKRCRK